MTTIKTSQGREKRLKMMEDNKEMMVMEVDDDDAKMSIYVHLEDTCVTSSKVVSLLYKAEIDSNVLQHQTLSPSVSAVLEKSPNPDCIPPKLLNLPLLKPAYIFNCNERLYPSGMSFVNIVSILYFMGGDISYIEDLMSLGLYYDLDIKPQPHPQSCYYPPYCPTPDFEHYPPDVYAFDCVTSKLLDSSSPYWIPPMISGKPQHPITFALDQQLFVLSSQNAPPGFTYFETYNPSTKMWEQLPLPDPHFFNCWNLVSSGFLLAGRELFVTFSSELDIPFSLLWYNIDSRSWTRKISPYLPHISTDSVFVRDTIYAFRDLSIISLGLCDTIAATIDAAADDSHIFHKLNRRSCTYTSYIKNWPVYVNKCGDFAQRLFHLGGLLKGTTNNSRHFGLVELFNTNRAAYQVDEDMPPCELHFLVLEPLDGKSVYSKFSAKFIHACHFSPEISSSCVLSAAVALRLY